MRFESINFVYLSEILGRRVVIARDNVRIGRVVDLAATTTGAIYPKITALLARSRGRKDLLYIPWSSVRKTASRKSIVVDRLPEELGGGSTAAETEILLKKSFLDRQIISTSGSKVVRVNDLHFLVDNSSKENPNLWLVHIDIGVKGLLRRLGWVRWINASVRWIISRDIRDKFVSWKHVQPTSTTDVYGDLHLKTDSSKLSEILPADLADILEDLGTDERQSLMESLDPETAAATLQEMPLNIRVQSAEALDAAKLASIIVEMPMDEAVDLLDELSPERRHEMFHLLPPEKVADIKELSRLSIHTVGSIMNTDFIVAQSTQTVDEVMRTVRAESKKAELLYYVYIVDNEERLKGIVTLRQLLTEDRQTIVADIMREHVIAVSVDTSIKRVAHIFFKYNFGAVPVVDEENRMKGIVTLRDTLESVFPEVREESKG